MHYFKKPSGYPQYSFPSPQWFYTARPSPLYIFVTRAYTYTQLFFIQYTHERPHGPVTPIYGGPSSVEFVAQEPAAEKEERERMLNLEIALSEVLLEIERRQ